MNELLENMEKGTQMDDCNDVDDHIMDFTKAFDKVPHQRLISKRQYYGVQGEMLVDQKISHLKKTTSSCW